MAKAMLDEILRMMDSGESGALTPEALVAHLDQFMADPPEEKLKRMAADDTAGKEAKERFWSAGAIACADNTIVLRKPIDSDRDGFLRLQQEYSSLRSLLKDDGYCTRIWNGHNENTALMLSITQNGEYIGYCGIKDLAQKPWEIAIELLPEWTHHKIGTTAVSAMLDAVKERLDVVDFSVKIDPTNTASQGLFEKLGAKPSGVSKFILHDEEEIRQCEEANLHRIDDTLIAAAQKFHVEPRKLLSHVLEYRLCWN